MNVSKFLELIETGLGINFYAGVPDSQLKPLCDTLYTKYGLGRTHIVTANEGAAVGLAAGHYLATGKPALVYLQNSGLGNIVNPVASLLNERVYGIPCLFVVGWRGEPDVKDEPQHIFQGQITTQLLDLLEIESMVLSKTSQEAELSSFLLHVQELFAVGKSAAIVVKKGALVSEVEVDFGNHGSLTREEAIRTVAAAAGQEDVFVSTTGKASRELFEIREQNEQGHKNDFLTVGSMGHASMIALGVALAKPERTVWCIDGDGAAVMHMGSMLTVAQSGCGNLVHIVINNGAHESVGGMPVVNGKANFCTIGQSVGYGCCYRVQTIEELTTSLSKVRGNRGVTLVEVMTQLGSREDLGRPTATPQQNKVALMNFMEGNDIE